MHSLAEALGVLIVSWLTYQWYAFRSTRAKIDHIPTVGSDGFIGSYLGAWKYFLSGYKVIEEGYEQALLSKCALSRPNHNGWIVVSGQDMVEELRRAPESELSSVGNVVDLLQVDYVLGKHVSDAEWYHVSVTQKQMNRNVSVLFPGIMDEMRAAFEDHIPLTEDWTSLKAVDTFVHMVCRIVNRFFFPTLQLHKDAEFLKLQTDFSVVLILTATVIGLFPTALRHIVTRLISRVPRTLKKMKILLGPMLEERLRLDTELGRDWEGKPNDLVSWLLEATPPAQRTVDDLIIRIMKSEFGGLHTTSIVLSDTLFDLAARPEYIQPLREEIEEVISQHGWTKDAFSRMHKLDSVIKESSRLGGLNFRKAAKDFTFSNGLTIPAGYSVGCVSRAMQRDLSVFKNGDQFDGFRFIRGSDEPAMVSGITNPDINFVLFGSGGRHHCPGRFLAIAELKAMLSHILINYDIRLPGDLRTPPAGQFFGTNRGANTFAKLEFRKRRA
ncbi:cytochrome P450 [Coprinellus micaceus]|uniref:Cytochrome P450 n=1 Tax=Coprinellus micaceus TaxID=71717 RepID=A0A4Y7U026_COPMI|nr:cytochrome P450 [Coprinellus micaceus]